MSGAVEALLNRARLVLSVTAILAATGLLAWFVMPRQEDPSMPDRFGLVIAAYPGADAETVERLVTEPIEEKLAQVGAVFEVSSTSRTDVAVMRVRLADAVYATREAWDEVEDALEEAQAELPEGARPPQLEHELIVDQHAVVLAVTGSLDRRALRAGAERLKKALLRVPGVSEVSLEGDPEEQVLVELDEAQIRRYALAPGQLVQALAANNASLPAGVLAVSGRNTVVRAKADLQSMADLRATEIPLPAGGTAPLSELARVRLGPAEPAPVQMRTNGALAVGVAVVPQAEIDVVQLGARVRAAVEALRPELAPLEVTELSFQPDYVSNRLSSLGGSLMLGIAIVAGVLVLAMGLRLGLVVSAVVPLVALSALAVYAFGGGVLHQISVAALIIALGMLVDNAIVVAESVQEKLDRGTPSRVAAREAVRELAVPLATATGTTLAAFVPMAMSKGSTGDFTRAIPIVIMLTLVISYLYAVLVTPNLACLFLRGRARAEAGRFDALTRRIGGAATRRPWAVLAVALVLVGLSGALAGRVDKTFFPASGRNQLVAEVVHAEGTHIDRTDDSARAIEQFLLQDPRVRTVSAFVGRSAPRFYYNLPNRPQSPHFAHVIIQTARPEDVAGLSRDLLAWAARAVPDAEVIPRTLQQGPPVVAPIELRLEGESLPALHAAAEAVMGALRAIPGTRNVTHNLGLGVPSVEMTVHDAASARRGLARRDVATALLAQTRGLPVGNLRSEADPIPIVVRSSAGERLAPSRIGSLSVPSPTAGLVPLAQVGRADVVWRPAAIHHRNRAREVSVTAHLDEGLTFGPVLAELQRSLPELPEGVTLRLGGAASESGAANGAIAQTAPLGAMLLLLFLMLEFNSFRRVGLILLTVPLAAAGVIPGLLIADQPFGFMSLLGIFALVGVVVNNAIVLVDVIDARRREGAPVVEAVIASVQLRARPILLTTATTVAGLLPLALSPSPLWPPMASAMIAGLLASTFLTLGVVPAAYTLLFRRQDRGGVRPSPGAGRVAAAVAAALLLFAAPARAAETVSLSEALARGAEQPRAQVAAQDAVAAEARADAAWRQAYLPTVGAEVGLSRIDRQLSLVTPIGDFPFGNQSAARVAVTVTQPIVDLSRWLGAGPAASREAAAAALARRRVAQEQAVAAGERFLDVRALRASLEANAAFIAALESRAARLEQMATAGRALTSDLLRVRVALADAEQDSLRLRGLARVARRALAEAIGADGPVDAGEIDARPEIPARDAAMRSSLQVRPDLRALAERTEAAQERKRGVWSELLPRVEARGLLLYDSGLPYDTQHYLQGSINAVWNPFAAGTRFARADAEGAAIARRRAELEDARRGVRVQVEAAYAELETATGALAVATRAVEQARETVRVERLRYTEGQVTMADLLEAEALWRQQRTRRAVAEVDVTRARLRAQLAAGALTVRP